MRGSGRVRRERLTPRLRLRRRQQSRVMTALRLISDEDTIRSISDEDTIAPARKDPEPEIWLAAAGSSDALQPPQADGPDQA